MATIVMMRFNEEQAVLISDESTWHLGVFYDYRRTNFGDMILPIYNDQDETAGRRLGIYAGIGFPSFHSEIAEKLRRQSVNSPECAHRPITEDGAAAMFRTVHHRYVNDRMRFHFGFDMNELNTRQLQSGNKSEIKQDSVLKEARKISDYADRCDAMQRIFDNSGAWVSFDEEQGIRGCVMGPGYRSIAFSSPMTIIGHGTAVANESMNRHFVSRMDLTARRQGFSMTEGLHHALLIATETQQKTNKMGGDFQIQLINMKADKPEDRLREICDDRSRLAMEILTAELENQIDEATATELTAALLLENQLPEMVENTLFERAKSAEALFLHLAGFRRTVQDLVPTVTTEKGSQS